MNKTAAKAIPAPRLSPQQWLGTGLMALAVLGTAQMAKAEDKIIKSHGYNFFGELVYEADYDKLNYVNPDAPKGGEISIWAPGTFDSFNLYTRKGRAGALSTIGHEDLLTSFADDPTALYCQLCETMEYPESIDWVIFNLRPEVRMADGRPWNAEDLKFTYDIFMEQGLPSFRAAFGAMIASVEVLDEHRIRFNFNADSPVRDRIGLAGISPPFRNRGSMKPVRGSTKGR